MPIDALPMKEPLTYRFTYKVSVKEPLKKPIRLWRIKYAFAWSPVVAYRRKNLNHVFTKSITSSWIARS